MQVNIFNLPNELLLSICGHLGQKDLVFLIRTNRHFSILAKPCLLDLICKGEELPYTAFFWAVAHRNEEYVRIILEKAPKFLEFMVEYPLRWNGFDECTAELTTTYKTPEEYHDTMIEFILDKGPDLVLLVPDCTIYKSYRYSYMRRNTAFYWAMTAQNLPLTKMLLDHGADPSLPMAENLRKLLGGNSALNRALSCDHNIMVKMLAEIGVVDIDAMFKELISMKGITIYI